jgi:hypothetical protein
MIRGALLFKNGRICLEGIVSKRLGAPDRSGRSTDYLKIKKPGQPGDDPGAGSERRAGTALATNDA